MAGDLVELVGSLLEGNYQLPSKDRPRRRLAVLVGYCLAGCIVVGAIVVGLTT